MSDKTADKTADKTFDPAKTSAFLAPKQAGSAERRSLSGAFAIAVLLLILFGVCIISTGIGAYFIKPLQVIAILLGQIGIDLPVEYTSRQETVLLVIRLPRVVMGVLIGASLGISGTVIQGVFRNPLASPGLIGVSSGAAAGAAIAIVTGINVLGIWTLPFAAFWGGLGTAMVVYRFARRGGFTDITTLLLVGIAVNALMGAIVSFLSFISDDAQLRSIVFWMMGSLSASVWPFIMSVFPFMAISFVLILRFARTLNLLALGEAEARHLGIDTERARVITLALASIATGAAVSVAGIIGFVGLVAPHLLRLIIGPDHRTLLPASAIGGAILLVLADLFARTVVSPTQLPLGLVTALVGAPFFLYLIEITRRNRMGG
jgi:iron complex transport system permease protein